MTKFIVGLLLGSILGIAGTAAFLITAQGGDYLVATSPRVRELENSLKQGDREREWLRDELRASADVVSKLESRFIALATRFEDLTSHAATLLGAPETGPTPGPSAEAPRAGVDGMGAPPAETTAKPVPAPTATLRPAGSATPGPTAPRSTESRGATPRSTGAPRRF